MRIGFDDYFLGICNQVKLRSPDITKVGAVLVSMNDNRIISTGYNGSPPNCNDNIDWTNREFVHSIIIHAELNCLLYANSKFEESILYITLSPCIQCIKIIASAKIKKVIYIDEYRDIEKVRELCKYFGIVIEQKKVN